MSMQLAIEEVKNSPDYGSKGEVSVDKKICITIITLIYIYVHDLVGD